jgi:hypothetical protein
VFAVEDCGVELEDCGVAVEDCGVAVAVDCVVC